LKKKKWVVSAGGPDTRIIILRLFGLFGVPALTLAAIGVFGAFNYSVIRGLKACRNLTAIGTSESES
jgi:hypothetical protein